MEEKKKIKIEIKSYDLPPDDTPAENESADCLTELNETETITEETSAEAGSEPEKSTEATTAEAIDCEEYVKSEGSSAKKSSGGKKNDKKKRKRPKNPVLRVLSYIFPSSADRPLEVIRKIVFISAFIILFACGYIVINYYSEIRKSVNKVESIADQHEQLERQDPPATTSEPVSRDDDFVYVPDMLKSQKYYYDINSDVVGWVEIEGTHVDLPILQGEDNSEYLKKDLFGEFDDYGSVFLDYRCIFTYNEQSENLMIYGHDTTTNSMFGDLDQYKTNFGTIKYLREHPVININSNYFKSKYIIFAVILTNAEEKDGPVWDYQNRICFYTQENYEIFISDCKTRSLYDTNIDVQYGEKLVTLSTCAQDFDEARLLLVARELRDGETAEQYIDSYDYNPNPLQADTYYKYAGGSYDKTDTRYTVETLYPKN